MPADFGAAIGGGTLVALGSAMLMEGMPPFFFGALNALTAVILLSATQHRAKNP